LTVYQKGKKETLTKAEEKILYQTTRLLKAESKKGRTNDPKKKSR
jgi:hypothetical protein